MFKLEIDSKDLQALLKRIDNNIVRSVSRMQLLMKGQQGRIALKAIKRLGEIPGPPQYPIRWKSERQRRAFFASKGFGRGVPTKRKNVIIKGWYADVRADTFGGAITLKNPHSEWVFLQGSFAQPFHIDTGYTQLKDVVDDFYQDGTLIIADTWFRAADPFQ